MFDIGLLELLIVGVIGLLVIGPEKLPETVRTVSLWIGRIKRSLRATRSEIEDQIGADDIRRQLYNEEIMRNLNATQSNIERTLEEEVFNPSHLDEPSSSNTKTETAKSQTAETMASVESKTTAKPESKT